MKQALANVEARRVREIVKAGISSYRAGRTRLRRPLSGASAPRVRKNDPHGMLHVVWTEEVEVQLTAIPSNEAVKELLRGWPASPSAGDTSSLVRFSCLIFLKT